MITASEKQMESAIEVFRCSGGMLRTGEALRRGIHRRTLYAMRDTGILERLERGLYRLAELPPLTAPDLVTAMRYAGTVCWPCCAGVRTSPVRVG